jgi:folate-binding protein YgfZ
MPAPSTRVVAAAAPGYTATMTLSEKLAAAREAVAVGPVEAPGVLRVTGKDRQDFLHRMCTQKVNGVAPGEAVHAAFLTAKGRVLAEGMVLVRAEDVLLVVHPRTAEPLRVHLVKYVIMDEVEVEDASAGWRLVAVLGPGAADLAGRRGPSALAFADPRRGAPAQDLLAPPEEAEALRARLAAAGATPLEEGDLEVLRILGGAARFGVDVDEERLPMEAGLIATAVSFDKGCYLGQEVVLRGTFRSSRAPRRRRRGGWGSAICGGCTGTSASGSRRPEVRRWCGGCSCRSGRRRLKCSDASRLGPPGIRWRSSGDRAARHVPPR